MTIKPIYPRVLCLMVFAGLPVAQAQNPSIMFQNDDDSTDYLVQPQSASGQDARCAEMARQIEALRGKPQRRYIAIKRYDLECKGGSVDYERFENEGFVR